jgi:hypothetical protein
MNPTSRKLLSILVILSLAGIAVAADPPATQPLLPPQSAPAGFGPAAMLGGPVDRGTITKVDPMSITIRPAGSPRGAPAATTQPAEKTFSIDENTTVFVGNVTASRQDVRGNTIRNAQMAHGSVNDLAVGQTVLIRAEGDVALNIMVMPAGGLVQTGGGGVLTLNGGALASAQVATGTVFKVDANSLTLDSPRIQRLAAGAGAPATTAPAQRTFTIDDKTRVFAMASGEEIDLPDGQRQRMFRTRTANISELKVGERVSVNFDGDVAVRVSVMPPPPTRNQGPPTPRPAAPMRRATAAGPMSSQPMVATVRKLDATSITLDIIGPWPRGAPVGPNGPRIASFAAAADQQQTFQIDEKTKVYVGAASNNTEGDVSLHVTSFTPADLSALKVDQTVIIHADGGQLQYIGTLPSQ